MTSQALAGGLSVTGRILVAVLLGYALAYAVTACLSIYLPLPRPDRVSFGSLGCFAVWVAAIVYAFAARAAPGAPAGCWRWPAWRWAAWPGSASTTERVHEPASIDVRPAYLVGAAGQLAAVRHRLRRQPGQLRQGADPLDAAGPAPARRAVAGRRPGARLVAPARPRCPCLVDAAAERAGALLERRLGAARRQRVQGLSAGRGERPAAAEDSRRRVLLHPALRPARRHGRPVHRRHRRDADAGGSGQRDHRAPADLQDFFTLRPQAARQRAWLDAHNVLG